MFDNLRAAWREANEQEHGGREQRFNSDGVESSAVAVGLGDSLALGEEGGSTRGVGAAPERAQEALAAVFFFLTFATIIAEIVAREIGHPVVWGIELPTYCFIWAFSFASGLADWRDEQINFPLLAERLPPRLRLVLSIVVNAILLFTLVVVVPGTLSFLSYLAIVPNTGLPGSELIGDGAILAFFVLGALLRLVLLVRDVRALVSRPNGR